MLNHDMIIVQDKCVHYNELENFKHKIRPTVAKAHLCLESEDEGKQNEMEQHEKQSNLPQELSI